jgi:DNA polymerase-3 subunit gamma/tau
MAESNTPVFEVTASRRRPKTFDELAGQEFVVSTLKNSLASGHIAHAYLFSGPRGCGKTSAARILARSLNCEKKPTDGPCGICDNCRAITQGASMDVIEIDGASNNSVNDVRQIRDEVLFPPQSGRYKVYIIDEVHMLSGSAFNALLKTIEEPPPYIVFIFATTELHKVPATIKSRCQQFNFRLIPVDTIKEILKKICDESEIRAEDDALFWIARESTGSMRDAYTLFDQIASFSAGSIRSELIRQKLGLVGLEKLNALAEACAVNNASLVFSLIDEIIDSGVAIEQFVIDLAGYFRSLLLLKNGVMRESLLGYKPSLFSTQVLGTFDSIRLEQALDILLDCYRDIRYSVSPRFELETAVSKLSWLNRWVTPAELKDAMDNARITSYGATPGSTVAASKNSSASANNGVSENSGYSANTSEKNTGASPDTPRSVSANNRSSVSYEEPSLSDDFRRIMTGQEIKTGVTGERQSDEDDVPMWDSVVQKKNEEIPPQVERVLSMIPGTIIE